MDEFSMVGGDYELIQIYDDYHGYTLLKDKSGLCCHWTFSAETGCLKTVGNPCLVILHIESNGKVYVSVCCPTCNAATFIGEDDRKRQSYKFPCTCALKKK